jgi:hypothetical protein
MASGKFAEFARTTTGASFAPQPYWLMATPVAIRSLPASRTFSAAGVVGRHEGRSKVDPAEDVATRPSAPPEKLPELGSCRRVRSWVLVHVASVALR